MHCRIAPFLFSTLIAASITQADVKMPAIFSDHMALQRDVAVPVWGWADAAEAVTIKIGDKSATATAGADGKWMAKLDSLAVSNTPTSMTISGKNTIEIKDVLVGDVWICAGQSNMGYTLNSVTGAADAMKNAGDDDLRLFAVTAKVSFDKQIDCEGKWQHATPQSAGLFTAVGYFFGRDLRKQLKYPVGLIETSLGGTSAQSWTSREGLEAVPALQPLLAAFDRDHEKLLALTTKYDTETLPAYNKAFAEWRSANDLAGKKWQADLKAAQAAGQPAPEKPKPTPNRPSIAAAPNRMTPTVLNNAMLQPILPFAIKGVAWYQGENNANDYKLYAAEFPAMIADWRKSWGQGDFPFVYVQLSAGGEASGKPGDPSRWAVLREAQLKTLAVPNTGMAVSFDAGDPTNVHFKNKQPVGERLALVARHVAYGESIDFSGPLYDKIEKSAAGIRVSFKYADAGLMVGGKPLEHAAAPAAPDGTALTGFEIAGADKKFVSADAKIDGGAVVVSSANVADPVAVRYGWSDNPNGNLYGKNGLPASPFRTDDWEK